jgi:hypothetical protein
MDDEIGYCFGCEALVSQANLISDATGEEYCSRCGDGDILWASDADEEQHERYFG